MAHDYLSFSDSASYSGKVVGTSSHELDGNGLTDKTVTAIIIPSMYDNQKVVELGYCSFRGTSITSVFIAKTVRLIGNGAFLQCPKLSKVKFEQGSSVEMMDNNAFHSCSSLEKIDLPPALKTVTPYAPFNGAPLSCVSYFGTNQITRSMFSNNPTIHVLPSYGYSQFAQKNVLKDGVSCGVSDFFSRKTRNVSRRRDIFHFFFCLICVS